MALGVLVIFYLAICVISIGGFLALYLVKNERVKKVVFYILSVWGIALAALQAVSLPMNWTGQRVATMGLGALCVVSLALYLTAKSRGQRTAACLLLTIATAVMILRFVC